MRNYQQFYINGQWVAPSTNNPLDVINPATEQTCAQISLGAQADVDAAVSAARDAFQSFGSSARQERIELFESIISEYKNRYNDIAEAISEEMGAPISLATKAQTGAGLGHLKTALAVLKEFHFEEQSGASRIYKEPIGVCGLITPWNWPMNQITCKVAPALATGCTMILKPSEIAPLSGYIFAQIMDKAGVPAGVFNLINGDGPGVGTALSSHPQVDMMSFTGSTRAGSLVAQNAAPTVKRVTQELGGKSANIILDDADFEQAVKRGTFSVFNNTGQSCNAPTRMLVPADKIDLAAEVAANTATKVVVGAPNNESTTMGPLVSKLQFDKVQGMIEKGLKEGATLICGGPGKPEGLEQGYFVKPTVFSNVNNEMTIAREEIFGPVLSILPYANDEEAIAIANDTPYGLAGYIQGNDQQRISYIASKIRAGNININGQSGDLNTPFGGYKQSGNGREWGVHGFEDYLEIKAVSGLE
ncbi:aldehyde dehydrogenase family protein [Aliikangiella coralliicola]|uniref:aldehyde dehydrogenase (NAD(+)) n=1 Tax=Aliikangiella coralliicola TaxID=2592383 RepID=A0A545TS20_9GAMM|nr:aldehyde dehydrogenase family protein [Aliikangiella coralliicola]TQV80013.1 aldehyde dehydrogenase family protein [Aliikangiella coralliicola]